jgi:hypothetical protein
VIVIVCRYWDGLDGFVGGCVRMIFVGMCRSFREIVGKCLPDVWACIPDRDPGF